MGKFLQRSFYVLFSLFVLYCLGWYGWGIYVKKIIHDTLSSSDKYIIKTDKMELSGFPLSLAYDLRNLSISYKEGADNTTVNLGNPRLKSDLILSRMVLTLNDDVNITSSDSKHHYLLKYEHGASLEVKLQNPYGYKLFDFDYNKFIQSVSLHNIAQIQYQDIGYSVRDVILEKILFTSPKNDFALSLAHYDKYDDVSVTAALTGDGGLDSPVYMNGAMNLDVTFNTKLFFADQNRNGQMNGVAFDVDNFKLTTQGYNLSLAGKLSVMNSSQDSGGSLALVVNNVPNFLNIVGQVSSVDYATYLKGLFIKMAGIGADQSLENLDITIKAEDKTIKFGNATIVDLMLYSLHR